LNHSSLPFTVRLPDEFLENFSRSPDNAKNLPDRHADNSGRTIVRFRAGQTCNRRSYLHGDPRTTWPYDMKQMAAQTVAELRRKDGKRFDVAVEAPAGQVRTYTLDGEVTEWHPGNRAKRWVVGMGSGRETAKIHYWLTDASGKKVFDHTDTNRAAFWGDGYADSVGQLAQPFADKIAEAKL